MVKIIIEDGCLGIKGTFDFGYIGTFKDSQIEIVGDIEEIRSWDIVTSSLDTSACSDDDIAVFLTNYLNGFEAKIRKNIKQVNGNFLLRVFEDMEACGCEFWKCSELVFTEKMPDNPEEDVYQPNWDMMTEVLINRTLKRY